MFNIYVFQRKLLDASLGFAAGVMTAASFWSLLSPAIEQAVESKLYGEKGEYAFLPVAFGFLMGALFVYGADRLITVLGLHSPNMMLGEFKKLKFILCLLLVCGLQKNLYVTKLVCEKTKSSPE